MMFQNGLRAFRIVSTGRLRRFWEVPRVLRGISRNLKVCFRERSRGAQGVSGSVSEV